jgi:hypothetical protein
MQMQMPTHSWRTATGIRKGLSHVGRGVDTFLGVLPVIVLVSYVLDIDSVDDCRGWARTEEQPRSASQSP